MSKNKYLGRSVKDTGKKGLDNLSEVRGISRKIVQDVKSGKISYIKGMRRLNFLSLIVSRDKNFTGFKKQKAKQIIRGYRLQLRKLKKKR